MTPRDGLELVREIVRRSGGDWHGTYGLLPAIGHSPHDRSVSVKPHPSDHCDVLVHCFGSGDAVDHKREWRRRRWLPERPGQSGRQYAPPVRSDWQASATHAPTREAADRLWKSTVDAEGTPAAAYVRKCRRIAMKKIPLSLRYHPLVPRGSGPPLPGMVAAVTVPITGAFCGVHRIYLVPDGLAKANLPKAQQKQSLGPTAGGAVVLGRLENDDGVILEGEGIETTLTVSWITGRPGVATLSASTLGRPPLPPGRPVIILADSGAEAAAQRAAQLRWAEGRQVQIATPPAGFKDFNDVLMRGER